MHPEMVAFLVSGYRKARISAKGMITQTIRCLPPTFGGNYKSMRMGRLCRPQLTSNVPYSIILTAAIISLQCVAGINYFRVLVADNARWIFKLRNGEGSVFQD